MFRSATVIGALALVAVGCSSSSDDVASAAATGAGGGSQAGSGAGGNQGQAGSTGSGASGGGGSANANCELLFSSGFEQDLDQWQYDASIYSADGSMPAGRVSAWTLVHRDSGEPVRSGDYAYKGWITGASSDGSHRPYPGISLREEAYPTPLLNTFWVYQDDYQGDGWVHFGTWGNCVQSGGNCATGTWALHTMSVLNDLLELAHTDPHGGNYLGPEPRADFPYGQWTRFTVYIDYGATTGTVQVWQDGEPMLQADVVNIADNGGTPVLGFAHWGAYAAATVSNATQYNDDIKIWQLDAPLTDFVTEPRCEANP